MARPTRYAYHYVPRVSSVTYPITENIDLGTNSDTTVVVFIMSGMATGHTHDAPTIDGVAMTAANDPGISSNHRDVNNNSNRVMSAWYMPNAPTGTKELRYAPTDEPVQITFHVFVYHDAPGGIGTVDSNEDDTDLDANPTLSHTSSDGGNAHVAIGMMSTTFDADPYSSTTGFTEILDSENASPAPTNHSFLIGEDTTPSGSAETYESTQNKATEWIVFGVEVIGATAVDGAGQVSWAELEVPTAPRHCQVSWAELETPTPPRAAGVSWAEMEVPLAPRKGVVSWAELEVPTPPRHAQVSWAEMEAPATDAKGQVSWAEMQVPDSPGGDTEYGGYRLVRRLRR